MIFVEKSGPGLELLPRSLPHYVLWRPLIRVYLTCDVLLEIWFCPWLLYSNINFNVKILHCIILLVRQLYVIKTFSATQIKYNVYYQTKQQKRYVSASRFLVWNHEQAFLAYHVIIAYRLNKHPPEVSPVWARRLFVLIHRRNSVKRHLMS